MDTDSFIVHIKTEDIYSDIAKDVETRFDTSNYKLGRLLPKGKNKKIVVLMEDGFGGKIMKEFAALRGERCSYLTYRNDDKKPPKAQK